MAGSDGKIVIDIDADSEGYKREVSELTSKTSGMMSKVGTVGKAAGAAIAATTVAAAAAVGSLMKQSLDSYAAFEQLEGGVQTLFGAGGKSIEDYAASIGQSVEEAQGKYDALNRAQDAVMANAAGAFKTAGLSANAYMEQATSTAAALVSSLGGDTEKAAAYADTAIRDMSDNANKMGTSIELIQNAYNGFAKGNFTMLDNLKLGYGGTKTEMERLLADAEAISGIHFDISSYADMVDAIHVIQEEMGIAGTTAFEASSTIEGSVNTAKAAWTNWVTGLASNNADMGKLTTELIESIVTATENIIPRLITIAGSIATALPGVIQSLGSKLVATMPTMVPPLVSAVSDIVKALVQTLADLVPVLFNAAIDLFTQLVTALTDIAPKAIGQIPFMLNAIITSILDALPQMLSAALEFYEQMCDAILEAMPQIIGTLTAALPSIIATLMDFLPKFLTAAIQFFLVLAEAILEDLPIIISTLVGALPNIITTLIEFTPQLLAAAVQLFMALVRAIPQIAGALLGAIGNLLAQIPGKAMEYAGSIFNVGRNIVEGIVDGIKSAPSAIVDAIGSMIGGAVDFAKNLLGIKSPSRVFSYFGEMIDEGLAVGIDKSSSIAAQAVGCLIDDVTGAANFGTSIPLNFSAGTMAAIATNGTTVDTAMRSQTNTADIMSVLAEVRDIGRRIVSAQLEPVDITWNRRELGRVVRSVQ